jgi:hypothetical protein
MTLVRKSKHYQRKKFLRILKTRIRCLKLINFRITHHQARTQDNRLILLLPSKTNERILKLMTINKIKLLIVLPIKRERRSKMKRPKLNQIP